MIISQFSDGLPYVRHVQRVYFDKIKYDTGRIAYDHRIFYILEGAGTITLDGSAYPIHAHSLFYVPSGTPYFFQVDQSKGYSLYAFNFDYFACPEGNYPYLLPTTDISSFFPERQLEQLKFIDVPAFNSAMMIKASAGELSYFCVALNEFQRREEFFRNQASCQLRMLLNEMHRIHMRVHTAVSSGSWCGGQRQQCGDSGSGLR